MEVRQVVNWKKDALGCSDTLRALQDRDKETNSIPGLRAVSVSLGEDGEKSKAKKEKDS